MAASYGLEDYEQPFPNPKTLAEWDSIKSTKFDACIRILQHILSRDDAPLVSMTDGQLNFGEPPSTTEPVTQEAKVLIYQQFASLGPLLRKVSHLAFYHIPDTIF